MWQIIRRVGIAIGSLVAAGLVIGLVGGVIGLGPETGLLTTIVIVVLGWLIYRDILGRERGPGAGNGSHAN
jgi:hypothetical protein